jgi:N-acetylglucosamine kinase-like BadF-type ATPase
VVVVAGTGAMVQGVTRDGRRLHLDGLGPLLGDYGSGYQIGLAALQAVARATHHPRHATALTAAVEQALGLDLAQGAGPLVGYSLDSRDRAEIAGCAVLVDQAAEAGDAVAGAILERCAASQAEVVRDVVDRLAMAAEPYKLIAAGSVAVRSRRYWRHLCAAVATFAPRFVPVRPRLPAVVGIVARVLRRRAPGSGAREALLRAAANWPRDGETHVDGG